MVACSGDRKIIIDTDLDIYTRTGTVTVHIGSSGKHNSKLQR